MVSATQTETFSVGGIRNGPDPLVALNETRWIAGASVLAPRIRLELVGSGAGRALLIDLGCCSKLLSVNRVPLPLSSEQAFRYVSAGSLAGIYRFVVPLGPNKGEE